MLPEVRTPKECDILRLYVNKWPLIVYQIRNNKGMYAVKYVISAVLFLMLTIHAIAGDDKLSVSEAWIRSAPPTMKIHALYFSVKNNTSGTKQIISIQTEQYGSTELHTSIHKDGIVSMEKVEKIEIPANKEVSLKPGGLHGMLINPKTAMKVGDQIPITLTLKSGETISFNAEVKKTGKDAMIHRGSHGMKDSGEKEKRGSHH